MSAALIVHIGLLVAIRDALQRRPSFDPPTRASMELRLIEVAVVTPPPAVLPPGIVVPDSVFEAAVEPSAAAAPIKPPKPLPPSASMSDQPDPPDASAQTESAAVAVVTTVLQPPSPSIAESAASANHAARSESESVPTHSTGVLPRERQPRLVAPDGKVLLPEVDVAVAAAAAGFPTRRVVRRGGPDPLSRRSPLPYVATRFDPLWVPDGETIVDTFLRKLSDKLIKRSSTEVAGLQVDCVWILVVAGCTWGVPPRISIDDLKKMRADLPMPRGPRTQPGG